MKLKSVLFVLILALLFTSCNSTEPFVSPVVTESGMEIGEKLEYYGGKPAVVDYPSMYFEGDEWLDAMTELVDEAESYILLSTFLGSSSPTLENLFSTLCRKAEEGVDVYLIIDGISSLDMTESRYVMTPLNYLRESGVNLLIYAPLSFTHVLNPVQLLIRDHRKMMVIDGKIAAIGGMNINYISMGAGDKCQRDSMYVFHSASLCSLFIDEYTKIWNESSVERIDKASFTKVEENGEGYRAWLFNRNVYSGDVSISGMFASLIEEAHDSIFLCPYLPTVDDNMSDSLRRAVDRGVRVEILCSQDSRAYAMAGSSWAIASLLEDTGAQYYSVDKDEEGNTLPMFHMKMMIVDDRYIVVGSSNFNYRSMTLSHEIGLVVDSPEMAKEAKRRAKESGSYAREMTMEEAKEQKKKYGSYPKYIFSYYGG